MQITFHGVRGSVPSPGPSTASFGGNTSCVHVRLDCGLHLVFDAGTGIRGLGRQLAGEQFPIHLLLTHSHWDHIQGFPFFAPIHQHDRDVHVFRTLPEDEETFTSVLEQMNGYNFPVPYEELSARVAYAGEPEAFFARAEIDVRRRALNHPGGGCAYRVDAEGVSLAFVTDNELEPPQAPVTSREEWVAFCRGADVLIHDAQYEESDMPRKHGWGHSLVSQVRQLAHDADVGCVVLFHHDPDRTDLEVHRILRESEAWFASMNSVTSCLCAWEGLQLRVARRQRGRPCFEVNGRKPSGIDAPATDNFRAD